MWLIKRYKKYLFNIKLILRVFKSFFIRSDYKRWENVHLEDFKWNGRNQLIANLISEGSSVIDIGAGTQSIKRYLINCEYQPCDLVRRTEDTIYCDFNLGVYPKVNKIYDYVVCSGVLEYIRNPEDFISYVGSVGNIAILTYAPLEGDASIVSRLENGWVNHFSKLQIEELFSDLNYCFEIAGCWKKQIIYCIEKRL
ncbi:MAG: hypothetical protein JNM55_16140 [Anaerolineales bacterium]|nr:hypothetical protein [Anaerolineales bacterium]